MKLDYLKMLTEIDKLVDNDWGFEIIDCKNMPNAKPFTQKEAREMSKVLGQIYSIAHCISCPPCQGKYAKRT